MGDCIDRQAVFEQINSWIGSGEYRYTNATDYLTKRISKLPSVTPKQKMGRWIPVSERLPEKNMECLVAVGKFNFTQMAMYSDLMGTINHRIFYQGDYGHRGFVDITQYVNAWMPLPEPYKAESEDK